MIRLAIPAIEDDDLEAVCSVLRSGQLVQGAKVAELEAMVAKVAGTAHGVAVSNATAGLHLSLAALGVEPGDAIAVSAYSWPATSNVVDLVGAEPVFIDIDPGTYAMDPAALEAALARRRVRGVLVVHPFGGMADLSAILAIAHRHGAFVLEDAACALGASQGSLRAGGAGVAGVFSFHPRKAVTTGEGGVITTNDAALARTLRALRNHGLDPDSPTPSFIMAGHNLRLTELQGALGVTQMNKLARIIEGRRSAAARYDALLREIGWVPPAVLAGSTHVYQTYAPLVPAGVDRDALIAALGSRGIQSTIGTYHLPLTRHQRERRGFRPGDFPNTDLVFARNLALPLYAGISPGDQAAVVSGLRATP